MTNAMQTIITLSIFEINLKTVRFMFSLDLLSFLNKKESTETKLIKAQLSKTITAISVSYTHLDVYKRQVSASNGVSSVFEITVGDKVSKTMYATENLNVRKSASKNSSVIEKISAGTKVEVIKSGSFAMVNIPSGKVGFVSEKYLSSVQPVHISGVPYLNQFSLGLPTGCEAVSATMVLKYHGYNVGVKMCIRDRVVTVV